MDNKLEELSAVLASVEAEAGSPIDIESYVKRLLDAKKRVSNVVASLNSTQVSS